MPMFTQLESLDFTGKTVKAFVTHEGSGFGTSQKDIAKLCSGANIKKVFQFPVQMFMMLGMLLKLG